MMTMNDTVRYQLERAEDALRAALKLGAEKEDPYLLKNISETINTIQTWRGSLRYNMTKTSEGDSLKFNMTPNYGVYTNIPCSYTESGVRGGMADDILKL
jgi:hypothetical protein